MIWGFDWPHNYVRWLNLGNATKKINDNDMEIIISGHLYNITIVIKINSSQLMAPSFIP